MGRKKLFSIVLCASMLLLFMGPLFATPAHEGYTANALYERKAAQADTLIVETIGEPQYLDPHIDYETAGSGVAFQVYETLFTYPWMSADTDPSVPLLAESVAVSPDGLNYTFTLRQGITFQDGTPFNASCVKYNIERAMAIFQSDGPMWMLAEPLLYGQAVENAVYGSGQGSADHIGNFTAWQANNTAGVGALEVMGTYTIRMRLAYAYAPFIAALTYEVGAMMSPTWVEANGGVVVGTQNTYINTHMCGTGPYMLTEWIQQDHVTMDRNPNYWRDTATDPAVAPLEHDGSIQTIIVKQVEDSSTRILNIETGESDIAYWPTSLADQIYNGYVGDPGDGTLMSSIPQLKLWAGLGTYDVMFLGFNMNTYINQTGVISQSPFVSKNLRYALSYAFNYSVYIDQILNGFGIQLQGPIPQGMFGHNDSLYMFNYNMTKAVEYWNAAMADDGLDAIWANNSYSLSIYYNSGNDNREKACLMMKDGIDAIIADPDSTDPASSLTITVEPLNWPSYLYQVQNRQLPIFFLGWAPDYADPDNYVGPFVKSTGTYPWRIGLGTSIGWNAAEVDGWINTAAQSQNDTLRNELYGKIQDAIVEQGAYLWVYQAANFHVEYETVYGYHFNAMFSAPYYYNYWKVVPVSTSTTSTSTSSGTTSETTTTTSGETTTTTTSAPPVTGDMTLIYIAIGAGVVIVLLIVVVVMRRR